MSAPAMRKRLGRAAAWLITIGLLYFVFRNIKVADVVASIRGAAPWTVPACLASVVAIYLADSLAIWKTFGWFLAPFSYAEILVVRGATYLLAAVNYNVGQGAIVYFVNRARGIAVARGVSAVLLIMGINIIALLVLTTVGLFVAPAVPRALPLGVAAAWAGLVVYALVVAWKPPFLARHPLFEVLLSAGFAGHLRALAVRVPHIASLVVLQTSMLHAFGVAVPVGQAIATLPIVFFIAVLPISVQGLGVTQWAMIFFYARYAPGGLEAPIVTASLVSQAIATTAQVLIGLACLQSKTGRELRAAASAAKG
ncbi:MAG TPA: lysylphosphatidylglycerol synthase domain-containing protein [Polyangia bacterium]|nr:lysylphosphatidylglycerol synthase domain-containing protein [Polyangia bacterium]